MANTGRSQRGPLGNYSHYDSKGRKTGTSTRQMFGGYTHYDSKGHKTGSSRPGFMGSYDHYDSRGRKTGSSRPGTLGSYSHYDAKGRKVGGTTLGYFGSYNHNDPGGCYVPTCVYGSYDCPEVWTLRRFRDNTLANHWAGRAFIRMYYAVAPATVRFFGDVIWIRNFWKKHLNHLVDRLRDRGVEDTPYRDKVWR